MSELKVTAKLRLFSLSVTLMLAALIGVGRAGAQQVPTITQMSIQLWPEYDRAAMLVQYTGQDDAEGAVPLTFSLPATATLHVTAYVDPANGLVELQNEVDGDEVTLMSPNGSFHVEFYDALDTSDAERDYRFTWPGDYGVSGLVWSVQIPPGATDVAITPLADGPTVGAYGLDYYTVEQIGLAQGEQATITVGYRKASAALTAEPDELIEDFRSSNPVPLIGALIVGLAVMGGGAYYFMKQQRGGVPKRGAAKATVKLTEPKTEAKFCTQCGTPVRDASDKFCRECGTPLR